MTGPLLLCEADVVVEEATGGQMGEKAEVECAVSLRSGRGLYLSTLTLAVSLLRGSSAIISIAAAHQPIRAQLWASASRESHASGRGMTNKQASWEHKPLLFLQATNSEVTPPHTRFTQHVKTCHLTCPYAFWKASTRHVSALLQIIHPLASLCLLSVIQAWTLLICGEWRRP